MTSIKQTPNGRNNTVKRNKNNIMLLQKKPKRIETEKGLHFPFYRAGDSFSRLNGGILMAFIGYLCYLKKLNLEHIIES